MGKVDLIFRKANEDDIDIVNELYNSIHEYNENNNNYPGWARGVYPTIDTAKDGIRDGGLFLVFDEEDKLIASFILRHNGEEGYSFVDWKVELKEEEVYVIYTLVVDPQHRGSNYGKYIMEYIKEYAKVNSCKAVRLDVYQNNLPAIKLYENCGFVLMDLIDLGYGKYGLDLFCMYQYLLD